MSHGTSVSSAWPTCSLRYSVSGHPGNPSLGRVTVARHLGHENELDCLPMKCYMWVKRLGVGVNPGKVKRLGAGIILTPWTCRREKIFPQTGLRTNQIKLVIHIQIKAFTNHFKLS